MKKSILYYSSIATNIIIIFGLLINWHFVLYIGIIYFCILTMLMPKYIYNMFFVLSIDDIKYSDEIDEDLELFLEKVKHPQPTSKFWIELGLIGISSIMLVYIGDIRTIFQYWISIIVALYVFKTLRKKLKKIRRQCS